MLESKGIKRNLNRFFIFATVVAAVMYFLVTNFDKIGNILIVLIGFGIVVLVHEFGHFIFAKLSKVKVEAFSIGFSPILFGLQNTGDGFRLRILPDIFKKSDEDEEGLFCFYFNNKGREWETEYRIGLIPFGGFVKMLGQDDVGPAKATDDPKSYANKPVKNRLAIVAAGVTFNAISAILIFMITFMVGIDMPPATVGGVLPDSPAAKADLRPGDEIISIDGDDSYIDFSNIGVAAALSGENEKIKMKVKHPDGKVSDVELAAEKIYGSKLKRFGISPPMSLRIMEVKDKEALRENTGLAPGDVIEEVDRQEVKHYWDFQEVIRNTNKPDVSILAKRKKDGKAELVSTKIPLNLSINRLDAESEDELSSIYTLVPRLQAFPARDIDIEDGDILLKVADVNYPTYSELRRITEEYEGKDLPLTVLRKTAEGKMEEVNVTVHPKKAAASDRVVIGISVALDAQHPVVAETIDIPNGPGALDIPSGAEIVSVGGVKINNYYEIISELRKNEGKSVEIRYIHNKSDRSLTVKLENVDKNITVEPTLAENIPFAPLEKLYKAGGPIEALWMGVDKTKMFIVQSYLTLKRMIGGLVSPDMLVGPVGIVKLSYDIVSSRPLVYYVYFLGLINACIAVINLLPMLPFDGGIIVLLIVEKIKGSAVSEKVQGILAYVGIVVIGMFFIYVTFNDIIKIIQDRF